MLRTWQTHTCIQDKLAAQIEYFCFKENCEILKFIFQPGKRQICFKLKYPQIFWKIVVKIF